MNPIQILYKAITRRPLLTLFLLFPGYSSSIAQSSTTYNISGYCSGIEMVGQYNWITVDVGYLLTDMAGIYNIVVDGNTAYLAEGWAGLNILDVSDPSYPFQLGGFSHPCPPANPSYESYYNYGVAKQGNLIYLTGICTGNYGVLDILDLSYSTTSAIGSVDLGSYAGNDIAVQGNYAYIITTDGALWIFDVTTASNPIQIGYVSSTTGNGYKVRLANNYAYLAEGNAGIKVIDITNPANPVEISQINTPGIAYSLAINGQYLYVADGSPIPQVTAHPLVVNGQYVHVEDSSSELQIIDISDVSNPIEVGSLSFIFSDPEDVAISGNFAYVSNADVSGGVYADSSSGLYVVDISDPTNPTLAGFHAGDFSTLALDDNYVYASIGNEVSDWYPELRIININKPIPNVNMTLTGDTTLTTLTDTTGYYRFSQITNGNYTVTPNIDYLLFSPASTKYSTLSTNQSSQNFTGTLNVPITIASNPSGQIVSANGITTTTPFSFVVYGGVALGISASSSISIDNEIQIVFNSWSDGGALSHTVYPTISTTFTVSYDTQYFFVTTQYTPNNGGEITPFSGWVFNGTLLSCTAIPNNGFQFVNWTGDISSDSNPVSLLINEPKIVNANFSLISSGNFKIGGYCVRPDFSGDFYEVGNSPSQNESLFVKVNGNLAFLADGTAGLRIIDISNLSNPVTLGSYTTTDVIDGVDVQGNYAYVAAGSAGLQILDISNPSNPVEVGSFDTSGYYAVRVAVQGNYAYIAFDMAGLCIIDISNPSSPYLVSAIPTSGDVLRIAVSGNYAYAIEYVTTTVGWFIYYYSNLWIVDIRNPSQPQIVGGFTYGGLGPYLSLNGVDVKGNYAYLLLHIYDTGELEIVDITQPTNPVEISGTTIPGNPHGISVRGDFAYLASEGSGLQVVNVANPYSPYVMGSYQTPSIVQDISVSGDYAYIADDTSGLRIIHVAYPIPNTAMTLSGTTNQFTYTDSSGYYEFDNLPFGNYTVFPYNSLFGSFSPSTNTYTGLDYNQLNEDYVGTYSAWTNSNGDFANASDTENWAFQPAPNLSNQPTITWVPTYQGNTGVLQLTFSSQTQGIKMTSFTRFTPDTTNPWYRLRVTYYSDSIFNGYIIPVILTYHDNLSEVIQELGASFTGDSLIQPGTWYTLDAYLCCHDTSGQIQIIVDNNGSAANVYIDSIDLENVPPPGFTNSTYVTLPWGGFEMSTETSYWGLEPAPGAPNGQPTLGWESSAMSYSFTTSSQGQKMTSRNTFYIPVNSNAVMSFNVLSDSPTPTGLSVIGYLFAEKDVKNYIWDVAGVGNIGILSADTWNTIYVPLTSVSEQTSYRLQLFIRNTNQYPENVYLDDIELFYGSILSNNQSELVFASIPRELMD